MQVIINIISTIGYLVAGIALSFLLLFSNSIRLSEDNDSYNRGYINEVIVQNGYSVNRSLIKKEIEHISSWDDIEYISPLHNNISYLFNCSSVTQQYDTFKTNNYSIGGSYILDYLQGEILYGRKIESIYEVVMDEFFANQILSNYYDSISVETRMTLGINNIQNLINGKIQFYNGVEVKVVGISKGNSYSFYAKEELINYLALGQCNVSKEYNLIYDKQLIGENELQDDEVLLDKANYHLLSSDSIKIKEKYYKVIGYYESNKYNGAILSKKEISNLVYNYCIVGKTFLSLIVKDANDFISKKYPGYYVDSLYNKNKAYTKYYNREFIFLITIFGIIIFLICFFTIYIVKKNELLKLSEVYFFDLLFGKNKKYIFSKYLIDNLISFALSALPAFFISYISINLLLNETSSIFYLSPMPIYYFIIGIITLILFYIFVSFITFITLFNGTIIKFKNRISKEK